MKLDKQLAILEANMICNGLHSRKTVENALFTIGILDLDQIVALSSFRQEEIERILNYYFLGGSVHV